MNNPGQILGRGRTGFGGRNERYHGWIRGRNGKFTVIDFPGAHSTIVNGINDHGDVVGSYDGHAFLRDSAGNYTTIDGPLADTTDAKAINENGQITGFYYTTDAVAHGFVRETNGTFTIFDVPNNSHKAFEGPFPQAINSDGVVTGFCNNDDGSQSFVRDATGVVTLIELTSPSEIDANAINSSGIVVGFAVFRGTRNRSYGLGFLRDQLGNLFYVSPPIPHTGADVSDINDRETITGWYSDSGNAFHGYVK